MVETLAILLRSKSEEARPDGVVAIAAHRVADLASALFSRFIVFISQNLGKAVTAPVCRRMKGSGPYRPSGFDIR
jgi:hypothetical protein